MIAAGGFRPHTIDVSGKARPIVGLPEGVLSYRVRIRAFRPPYIYLRFADRIQQHLLLVSGDDFEPFEQPEAINLVSRFPAFPLSALPCS